MADIQDNKRDLLEAITRLDQRDQKEPGDQENIIRFFCPILTGKQIPIDGGEFIDIILTHYMNKWREGSKNRPPVETTGTFIPYLRELGVIRKSPDEKIEVTDLYMGGFGLTWSGGVLKKTHPLQRTEI